MSSQNGTGDGRHALWGKLAMETARSGEIAGQLCHCRRLPPAQIRERPNILIALPLRPIAGV